MSTYISKLNYLPNVKSCPNIRTVKYECILEVNFQRFLLAYLHEIEKNRRNIASSVHDVGFPYPFNNRVLYQSHSLIYDEEEKMLMAVGKPSVPEGMKFLQPFTKEILNKLDGKSKKTKVYPFFDFFFQKYQQIDEKKVLFSQVFIF